MRTVLSYALEMPSAPSAAASTREIEPVCPIKSLHRGAPAEFHKHSFESMPAERLRPSGR